MSKAILTSWLMTQVQHLRGSLLAGPTGWWKVMKIAPRLLQSKVSCIKTAYQIPDASFADSVYWQMTRWPSITITATLQVLSLLLQVELDLLMSYSDTETSQSGVYRQCHICYRLKHFDISLVLSEWRHRLAISTDDGHTVSTIHIHRSDTVLVHVQAVDSLQSDCVAP